MNKRIASIAGFCRIALFCSILAAPGAIRAGAQAAPQETAAALAKPVQLDLGVTTVGKVMAALSEQTGLTITASDYLSGRTVTVRMENINAAAALGALCELNDWTWSSTRPGEILVERRRLRIDAVPAAIPRQMQAAIPIDIRTYINAPTPTEDLTRTANVHMDPNNVAMHVTDRLIKAIIADQTDLLTSLRPGILTGDAIPYAKLTQRQRSELMVTLVFPLLRDTAYELLHGDLLPHIADTNRAVLQWQGARLLKVVTVWEEGNSKREAGGFFLIR